VVNHPGIFDRFAALQRLNLSNNKIMDNTLHRILSGLALLQHLSLHGCEAVTPQHSGLKHLSHLTTLRHLDLNWCKLSELGLGHLSSLTGLQELSLCQCSGVTDRGLKHLTHLSALQSMWLDECIESKALSISEA
jgi:hypothetical protein